MTCGLPPSHLEQSQGLPSSEREQPLKANHYAVTINLLRFFYKRFDGSMVISFEPCRNLPVDPNPREYSKLSTCLDYIVPIDDIGWDFPSSYRQRGGKARTTVPISGGGGQKSALLLMVTGEERKCTRSTP